MFVHEELLSIVFRLVNFGILVFLCVYVFKRYVLPVIKDQMQEAQEEQTKIKDRHKEIRKQEKIVTAFAADQEKLCRLLQEKIIRWQRVETDQLHKKEQEKERRMRYLKDRVVRQEQEFARQQLLHTITPRAVKEADQVLQEKFKTSEQKRTYIQAIVKQLRKEMA